MATMELNFVSECLMRAVTVNVVLPIDKLSFPGMPVPVIPKKFKTLYLLHGILGDQEDWLTGSRIKRWASDKNLAVVMPAGENGFYVDSRVTNDRYGEFIGKELVEMTRKMFPLSDKREDTFIAGLSMGGYGAIVNGLKYNDTFGYIGGLSSALVLDDAIDSTDDSPVTFQKRSYYERIFGDLDKIKGSDLDYRYLVQKIKSDGTDFPKMYFACGTEDSLIQNNEIFWHYLNEQGIEFKCEKNPGTHDWDFWDEHIYKFIQFLPLNTEVKGIDSGNVGVE